MTIIPIIILTIIGVKNDFELDAHLYGFIAMIGTLLYCIMDEYGWRGYLQEEFKTLKPWGKYLLIGFIWYLWHLTFITKASIGDNIFFFCNDGFWKLGNRTSSRINKVDIGKCLFLPNYSNYDVQCINQKLN
jgi:membrane protease YdiL (CAAX protease family)